MDLGFCIFLVNSNQSILPNVTVGYQIRDSCWFAPVALEQTIEFIGNSVLTASDLTTNINGNRARLAAIIGPGDSSITMQTHNILQLFEMPQIGYSATAKQLSDKEKFKYFTRVIASDTQQAQAIVDIIRQFNWSYVATIGTEGDYGRGGVEAIRRLLNKDACIGADFTMVSLTMTVFFRGERSSSFVANWCEYDSSYTIDSTTGNPCTTCASPHLFLS